MKQEVIQDFLNLPGIVGIALMDGRSRPYFFGVDRTLNFQQKEALAQGILQVIETIPDGFESFEFQFTGQQVHIYKLSHGIILLVLTRNDLVYPDYLKTIKNLKAALHDDLTNAIATFRLVAGTITYPDLEYSKAAASVEKAPKPAIANDPPKLATEDPAVKAISPVPPPVDLLPTIELPPAAPPNSAATLADVIEALNHLSTFTLNYLGVRVVANYWKSTSPDHEWLNNFLVDRSAQFSVMESSLLVNSLNPQELQLIREWVDAFIQRCAQVVRTFPSLVEHSPLSPEHKALLLG